MSLSSCLDVSAEVSAALKNGEPVVALESTIISHGMPYPENVESARTSEATIRAHGALPATVAVLNGKIKVGLSEEELVFLGQAKDIPKASRRDLPVLLAMGGPVELAHGSIRFTFGRRNTLEETDYTVEVLKETLQNLRAMSPLFNPQRGEIKHV